MICGCTVPTMFVDLDKVFGWYGSNGWIGTSTEDSEPVMTEEETE